VPDIRVKPDAASELVRRAARRLEEVWQHQVTVGDVLVEMAERSVFRTLAPDRSPVIVKADTRQQVAAALAAERDLLDSGQAERLSPHLGEANWLHEHGFDPRQPVAALHRALAAERESRSSAQPRW
jgi:hypothetical protein